MTQPHLKPLGEIMYITNKRLEALLGVPRVYYLSVESTPINNQPHYSYKVLNEFFRSCEHNLPQPLTIEDLLEGRIELVKSAEAAAFSSISQQTIRNHMYAGRIHYIRLSPGRIRIVKSSLRRANEKPADHFTLTEGAEILGFTKKGLHNLYDSRELTQRYDEQNMPYMIKDDFYEVIKNRAPDWFDPLLIVLDRIASSREPLLTFTQTTHVLGGALRVRTLMAEQRLPYINFGTNYMFFPEHVSKYFECDEIVTIQMIGTLFDTPADVVQAWVDDGRLACSAHDHSEAPDFKKACILNILDKCLPKMTPSLRWYDRQLQRPQRLRTVQRAATYLGVTEAEVMSLLGNNMLFGMRTPAAELKFTFNQVKDCKQRMQTREL